MGRPSDGGRVNYLDGVAPLYAVPGNHEFDTALVNAVTRSRFTWVGSNVVFETQAVVTVGDRKIGIFGLTLQEKDGGENPSYATIESDYLARAEAAIGALKSQGAEAIIGLTHLEAGR